VRQPTSASWHTGRSGNRSADGRGLADQGRQLRAYCIFRLISSAQMASASPVSKTIGIVAVAALAVGAVSVPPGGQARPPFGEPVRRPGQAIDGFDSPPSDQTIRAMQCLEIHYNDESETCWPAQGEIRPATWERVPVSLYPRFEAWLTIDARRRSLPNWWSMSRSPPTRMSTSRVKVIANSL
jgi:hypothetical protein